MASKTARSAKIGQFVLGTPEAVKRFRSTASALTRAATASKAAAIKTLRKEGIVTEKGNLTTRYKAK